MANVKWAAEVSQVREVSLEGAADGAFWRDRLAAENLAPLQIDGQAQVLIVSAELRFWGLTFRELSFSVRTERHNDPNQDAVFLLHAFNSRRLFAWCERAFFSTPYYHGDVRMSATLPVSIRLVEGDATVFRAEMTEPNESLPRAPVRQGEEGWDGPIYLPTGGRGGAGKLFLARLRGETRAYPFLAGQDVLALQPLAGAPVFQSLLDSHFSPREWLVRENATHAKSKTYARASAILDAPQP
jgi:hypothetical protein